jgi:predicted PurR-regulated permease PerM
MAPPPEPVRTDPSGGFFERVFGLVIVALLLWGTIQITVPFAPALVWGIMIAVSIWPLHQRLTRRLGGRTKLSSILLSLVLALALIMPVAGLLAALTEAVEVVIEKSQSPEGIQIPPPPAFLAALPLVGGKLQQLWAEATGNLTGTFTKLRPALETTAAWLARRSLDMGFSFLQFLLAIAITAPLLIGGPKGGDMLRQLANRLAPARGAELVDLAGRCVRSVSFGVIGTALVQGLIMAVGLAIAGVPGIVVLGFVSFLLAVLQVGVFPVWVLAALWLGHDAHTGWAIFLAVWGVVVGVLDNFMKPMLISQGTGLPLTIIFLGVLGGLITWGFVGIFVGPTVLAVTYTLMLTWLAPEPGARGG